MKHYTNHHPNTGQPAPRAQSPQIESFIDPDTWERLAVAASETVDEYDLPTLIADTPEVIAWLRDRMVLRPDTNENGGKSAAPFRLSMMAAADREAVTLAYWCEAFGIVPSTSGGLWVESGRIAGVCGDDLSAITELADRLALLMTRVPAERVGSDPVFGVWTVRRQHFVQWPELAGHFKSAEVERVAAQVVEEEGLW